MRSGLVNLLLSTACILTHAAVGYEHKRHHSDKSFPVESSHTFAFTRSKPVRKVILPTLRPVSYRRGAEHKESQQKQPRVRDGSGPMIPPSQSKLNQSDRIKRKKQFGTVTLDAAGSVVMVPALPSICVCRLLMELQHPCPVCRREFKTPRGLHFHCVKAHRPVSVLVVSRVCSRRGRPPKPLFSCAVMRGTQDESCLWSGS